MRALFLAGDAGGLARPPGVGGGDHGAGRALDHHDDLRGGPRAGPRGGRVDGGGGGGRGGGVAPGRAHNGLLWLEVGLLRQRAGWSGGDLALLRAPARVPKSFGLPEARPARGRDGYRRVGAPGFRAHASRGCGVRISRDAGYPRLRRGATRGLCGRRAAGSRAPRSAGHPPLARAGRGGHGRLRADRGHRPGQRARDPLPPGHPGLLPVLRGPGGPAVQPLRGRRRRDRGGESPAASAGGRSWPGGLRSWRRRRS